ncbi:MAG TPA: glycerol kinase, partial [Planctomycetes bacterium]|nr:glycerol kinase [Planctomycetota bacterium]
MAKNTYGTGCFMLMNTGTTPVASKNQLLTTIGWGLDDEVVYCLEGSIFIAGAVVQWLRDGLGLISTSSEVEALAATVDDSEGVIVVPAFVGLGAPYWDPSARGAILGLTRGTQAGHLARAAIESMAFQSRDVLDAMTLDAELELAALRVDGGASVNDSLMQFQADLLDVVVRRPVVSETTALGVAYLAGLAVGFWQDANDVTNNWALDREFVPQMQASESDQRYAVWKQAVERVCN